MTETPQFAFALHYVDDIGAAKRFYTQALGLKVVREHPVFVQFERFAIASDASMTGARTSELYWTVEDAERACRELSVRLGADLELTQQPFGKVFAVEDPAGNACYIVELARDRPSRAVG